MTSEKDLKKPEIHQIKILEEVIDKYKQLDEKCEEVLKKLKIRKKNRIKQTA